MLLQELQQAIINKEVENKFGNKLVFIGEETFLQNLYIHQIANKYNSKLIFADDFISIKKSLTANTMMDTNKVFVIRNDNEFTRNIELFKQINPARGKFLILIYDKVDKRSSFFKENINSICNFEKMTDAQLINVIHKYIPNLSDSNCLSLIEFTEKDYGRLLLEVDKLKTYIKLLDIMIEESPIPDYDTDEQFEIALKSGVIHQEVTNDIFKLIETILNKDYINIYTCLKNAKYGEFDVFSLIGLLYSNYKNLLLLKCSSKVNINPYIRQKLNTVINKYSIQEIIEKLNTLQEIEQGIKSGKIDSELADEILIARLIFRRN